MFGDYIFSAILILIAFSLFCYIAFHYVSSELREFCVKCGIVMFLMILTSISVYLLTDVGTKSSHYEEELQYKYAHEVCVICNERDEQD